jgi:hypothetical protein
MRKYWFTICAAILAIMLAQVGVSQYASAHSESPSLVTFTNGQILTHTDLNNSLAHIHNTLSGGITNTHISASAAIAYSKLNLANSLTLADTASDIDVLLPLGYATLADDCAVNGAVCTLAISSGVTSITNNAAEVGQYDVVLSTATSSVNTHISVTPIGGSDMNCGINSGRTTTTFTVTCVDDATGAEQTGQFSIIFWGR